MRRLALAVAAALALAGSAAAAERPLTVRASLDRASVLFGDAFEVQVEVAVDTRDVDPAAVRVEIVAGPFTPLGGVEVTRQGKDGVRAVQRLACLGSDCVPGAERRRVTLPAAHVRAQARSGARLQAEGGPLVVSVSPRVPADAVAARKPPLRRQTGLPPPSYWVSPDRLAAALVAAASVLVLAVAALVAFELRRLRRRGLAAAVDPLDRALRLVRESTRRPSADRRRAVGLLARVLAERGAELPSDNATTLAWSAPHPDPADAEALAAHVERTVVGKS